MNALNKYLVEFLGTLFIIYVILVIKTPIAIGAAVTLAILIGGNISGGNYNPVVTLAMTLSDNVDRKHLIPYIVAQSAGGLLAIQLYKKNLVF